MNPFEGKITHSSAWHFAFAFVAGWMLMSCGGGGGEPGPAPVTTPSASSTPPTIYPVAPVDGTVGAPYSFVYATAESPPLTFTVTSGTLPNGLSLTPSGEITGTPTQAGLYTGTVSASNGTPPTATQNFSITVTLTPPTPRANNATPTPLVFVANSGGADVLSNDTAVNTFSLDV